MSGDRSYSFYKTSPSRAEGVASGFGSTEERALTGARRRRPFHNRWYPSVSLPRG